VEPKSFVESAVVLLVATAFAVTIFRRFGLGSVLGLLVAGLMNKAVIDAGCGTRNASNRVPGRP